MRKSNIQASLCESERKSIFFNDRPLPGLSPPSGGFFAGFPAGFRIRSAGFGNIFA